MKLHIILFAIFITAIFFYPVFAYADKIGVLLTRNQLPEPAFYFFMGFGLLIAAGYTRRLIQR